ncbi:MAG TPA: cytochrome D1 domain-containing protein [Azospirillum sp.]
MTLRRSFALLGITAALLSAAPAHAACGPAEARGTNDLGLVIERAVGRVKVVENSTNSALATVEGLGDLSHASAVMSRDGRHAFVFGRDGGLSKVDLLGRCVEKRVMQAGNSIGGAISEDGRLVAVANYEPGGVKVFDAATLDLVADIPAVYGPDGARSKVVGLEDAPGNRFAFSLYDGGEIWLADLSDVKNPQVRKYPNIGKQPYDALVSPDGRFYIAGLFGEDGLAVLDLWDPDAGVKRVMDGYGRGEQPLPVYKMPHLEGWAFAGSLVFLPAIGRHEVLVVDSGTWTEAARIPVAGQPVFVVARPDGRQVWVNFAVPEYDKVQVIDVPARKVVATLTPGKGVLHLEFTPRGERVWVSVRDTDRVKVYSTGTLAEVGEIAADKPSGIFFTARAGRIGF